MKTRTEKNAETTGGIKRSALKVLAKISEASAAPPYGGDWPWCIGIIHQPKHPRLLETESKK